MLCLFTSVLIMIFIRLGGFACLHLEAYRSRTDSVPSVLSAERMRRFVLGSCCSVADGDGGGKMDSMMVVEKCTIIIVVHPQPP